MTKTNLTAEELYNQTITESTLNRQESIDPTQLHIIYYSKPHDICEGIELHLGNMASGFPHTVLDHTWKSTEYLYLLGEWSNNTEEHLDIQKDVLTATSGYAAKRYKKTKHKKKIREDFPNFRLDWMLWCIWQKCLHSEAFRNHLLSIPKDRVIVELVKKDPVWAAYPAPSTISEQNPQGIIIGGNAVGKCLTICRRCLLEGTTPLINYDLLNNSNIYILGKKVLFTEE